MNRGKQKLQAPDIRKPLKCDCCEMLSMNGHACHESGCPNSGKRWDAIDGVWIAVRTCPECGCECDADEECCVFQDEDHEPEPDEDASNEEDES